MHIKRIAVAGLLLAALAVPAFAQSDEGGGDSEPPPDEDVAIITPTPIPDIVPPFDAAHPCDQYWQIVHLDDLVQSQAEARQARALQGQDASDLPSIDQLIAWHGQLQLARPDARVHALSAGCF